MNRGIETAFWATLGKDPELKTSKAGTAYTGMNVVVTVGATDEGKDVSQWLRVTCFGDTAKAIASRAKKGDRVYIEGTLTLNTWSDKSTGEAKTGLNVAAWKCERVAAIGKNRERKPGTQDNGNSYAAAIQKPDNRRSKYDFDDELIF
jgi:single-strand DNA-binding protein